VKHNYPQPIVTTVPTPDMRNGNFAYLLNLGSSYTIYDPFSGVVSGSNVKRTPLVGT
jgi:hypothetical protein